MSVDELSVDGLSPHPVNTIYELANLQRGSRDTNLFLEELLNDTVGKVSKSGKFFTGHCLMDAGKKIWSNVIKS
jgi:hypothetical protein